jgi:hypothetical protein
VRIFRLGFCSFYYTGINESHTRGLVLLERIYSKLGVPVKVYPTRGDDFLVGPDIHGANSFEEVDEVCPPQVLYHSEIELLKGA